MGRFFFFLSLLQSCSKFILTAVWREADFNLKYFNDDNIMKNIQLQLCEFLMMMIIYMYIYIHYDISVCTCFVNVL